MTKYRPGEGSRPHGVKRPKSKKGVYNPKKRTHPEEVEYTNQP